MIEEKLKKSSKVPKHVRLLIADVLNLAYQIGQEGDSNEIPIPQVLSDDAMIAKFLEHNDITVHESKHKEDPTQTDQTRIG